MDEKEREKIQNEIKRLKQQKATIEAKILRKETSLETGLKSYSKSKNERKSTKTSEKQGKPDENQGKTKDSFGFF